MIISSFSCNAIVDNTITAVLTSASVYSNVVIQIAEYGSSGQLTNWTNVDSLVSTTQTINYTITNPNTTNLNVRLASTSPVCEEGSGSGSGSGSGGGGSDGSGGGSDGTGGGGGSDGTGGGGSDGTGGGSDGTGGGGGSDGTGGGSDGTGGGSDGSGDSGSDEESGSDEVSGSETGCDVCLSEVSWLYLCEGSGSETGGEFSGSVGSEIESGSESGSESGGGSGPKLRGIPAPPSIPDQHMIWPPVVNTGDNNFVFANIDQQIEFGAVFNPIRDVFDENIAEDKWTLFYYEITINNEIGGGSGSDEVSGSETTPNDRVISAIWVKRTSAIVWPGANYFSNYHIYGNPIGINMVFGGSNKEDFVRPPEDTTPLRVAGDIILDELSNIETVGGYLIETIKYIADNQLAGDGSHRIWGGNLSTIDLNNVLRVPGSTSTEDLDDITISLLSTP